MAKLCEICEDGVATKGKRCSYCKDRYDAQGIAFIIYCEFWRFEPVSPDRQTARRINHHFWVSDGKVQRAPRGYGYLIGKRKEYLQAEMENWEWRLYEIEPAMSN